MSDYELSFGTLDVTQFEKPLPEIYDLDKRFNHTYIIGKTGKGKSTLMENMALYDINFGLSVIFIDPSGVSCRKIYHNIKDKDRVIYISIEHPKVINPIHKEGYKLDILIQEFIQILDVLVTLTASNPESTVMMRLIIGHAMRAISREDQKNIQFINDLLLNRETRKTLARQLEQEKRQNTEEYKFWNTFDQPANWQRSESAQRVAARLSEISRGEMKQFTIGKNELDIEDIVKNKKVILVDTSRMTKNSKIYLTNLLVYAVYSYALFSENMFVKNPDPLLVYVDEFSIVVSDLFDELLATTRKQSIGFVLAHQNFSQIPKNILDTVMGVVDTIITFACGDTEAKRFSEIFDVKPRELMDLQPYSAWIRLGNENILTDLYEPIINYVPPLPENTISPKPIDTQTNYWFLADEKESWVFL